MEDSVSQSLALLHEKQDAQTEKINEVQIELATQKSVLDFYSKNHSNTATQLSNINERLSEYNTQLQIHIAGVQELKTQNQLIRTEIAQRAKETDARLDIAEKPIKWAQTTGHILRNVGIVLSAIAASIAIIKFFIR